VAGDWSPSTWQVSALLCLLLAVAACAVCGQYSPEVCIAPIGASDGSLVLASGTLDAVLARTASLCSSAREGARSKTAAGPGTAELRVCVPRVRDLENTGRRAEEAPTRPLHHQIPHTSLRSRAAILALMILCVHGAVLGVVAHWWQQQLDILSYRGILGVYLAASCNCALFLPAMGSTVGRDAVFLSLPNTCHYEDIFMLDGVRCGAGITIYTAPHSPTAATTHQVCFFQDSIIADHTTIFPLREDGLARPATPRRAGTVTATRASRTWHWRRHDSQRLKSPRVSVLVLESASLASPGRPNQDGISPRTSPNPEFSLEEGCEEGPAAPVFMHLVHTWVPTP
jgi:hypothetical protein